MDYCCTYPGAKAWRKQQMHGVENGKEKINGVLEKIRELVV
jgi:hypothetical protein